MQGNVRRTSKSLKVGHYGARNKKSREAFIQPPMQWGAMVHPIIYTHVILYMKKDQFTDTAPYNPVRLIVRKIHIDCIFLSSKNADRWRQMHRQADTWAVIYKIIETFSRT